MENRVFINDDNLVSRHSQDNYNEKLTQQYFLRSRLLCRVKSDPSSRDLAVSLHKGLTVTLSESWSQGEEKSLSECFIFRKHFTIKSGSVLMLKMMSCCCFPIFS